MATAQSTLALASTDHVALPPLPREMSPADVAAHKAASYVRTVRRDDSTLDASKDLLLTAASVEVAA
ncbi:hypothetical protein [Streptomyces sp. NPDC002215]|uniref:hypothetical protein n=1 Tax=Streptomyces sp. NPDC002215 TaxID=3154412 RepID=UPI003328EF91